MELPTKKYQIIYADPPWSIQAIKQIPSGRPNSKPYNAMRMVDIFKLPIKEIADIDCLLFLWVTAPMFPEGLYCLNAWGFDYKTIAFTWIKRNKKANSWFMGMGSWTRSNAEYCLLGIKGNPHRINADVLSVIDTPIEEHSKKPNVVRDKIIRLVGDLPKIELFAREKTDGWDSWGDEIPPHCQKLLTKEDA